MAAYITLETRDAFARVPTPKPTSGFRIVTKRPSFQSLNSPVITSPTGGRPLFSPVDTGSHGSPEWEHVNVTSPSTASHYSLYSDTEEAFRSPRLQLLTSNLLGQQSYIEPESAHTLISPSAPVQLPGDELLYDVAKEESPKKRFFEPDFQAALTASKQEMKDISLTIWGCPASHRLGSDLHALKQWAQQLSEFEPLRTRTVGLVGDAGVGKSSLVNSLLDQPDFSHSNIDNNHSTSIITEYRFRAAHYDEPFSVEVDYMSSEEIKELIEELVRSVRACYIPAFQDIDDLEERQEITNRSGKAWQTLHSMFRNQPIFTKEFLLEHASDVDTPLLNILQKWASDFLSRRPGGQESRMWSSTAFTSEECIDKLDEFTRDPVDVNTPALWPFIRVIRVYLRAGILQSGLVLVDCPSPRELNFARARATERYLRNCHEIFAVTTMEKALNDKAVVDIIKRNRQHRPLRIVCTKADIVNAREVERRVPDVSIQVRTWRQQIESLQKQVKRAEAQRRQGFPGALEEEARCRDMLQDMQFGLKKLLIDRRNNEITTQLINNYSGDVKDGNLEIFCISNKDYFAHRYDEQRLAESRLELTGILGLRKYCHSIPAAAQFDAAAAFIEHEVPAFLGSLKQWSVSGSDIDVNKEEEIRHLMKCLEETAIRKLVLPTAHTQVTRSNLNQEFASAILHPLREHRSEWRSAALEASKEWSKASWDAKDYTAFCRNYGNYISSTTGPRSWNEELIEPMRFHLQGKWGQFEEEIEHSKQELIHSIERVFKEISKPLKGKSPSKYIPAAPTRLQTLLDTLPHRLSTCIHHVDTSFADLLEGTQQLASDSLYGHNSSYINSLMAPIYHSTSLLPSPSPSPLTPSHRSNASSSSSSSRSTSPRSAVTTPYTPSFPRSGSPPLPLSTSPQVLDAHRKLLLTTHITSSHLFSRLATMIEKSHRGFVRIIFDNLLSALTRDVDAMIRDFHLVVAGVGEQEGRTEARVFGEFASGLRRRIESAECVLRTAREVVGEVRDRGAGCCDK
ncbi:hypothetical protein CC78DRAFT_581063 [Lojkania enalia]|uniref:DUF7605 domain-containing protein n=1 Tax=Lojkania enalia TaxID=147567 RepID=A0A9P4K9X3_9PLEO|nr:hypothetical protein CC78DRAFT_581063 [Didymosphaeria enalia]